MAQGVLPFKIEPTEESNGLTSLAGLPAYLELGHVLGLAKSLAQHLKLRDGGQGYSDSQMVMALVMMLLAGGDCVDDLRRLEGDDGFCRVLRRVEFAGLPREERRAQERRFRKERCRAVPSAGAARSYLQEFCVPEEAQRAQGSAFIPPRSEGLKALAKVNKDLVASVQARSPMASATLDFDATLVEVTKESALYCYKGFRGFQPLNAWWAEHELMLHTEFRDGNVPAGFDLLRFLQESLEMLPAEGVERVMVRSDTAGYQVDFLRYMAEGRSRFGRIEFAVGADVTPALKEEVARVPESAWKPFRRWNKRKKEWEETGREWAEVVYVPDWMARKKDSPDYRFLLIREPLSEQPLPGMESQLKLPFPTMEFEQKGQKAIYKLHCVITNRDGAGDDILGWYHERCGKSEEAHAILKHDLAGSNLPSKYFGVNAAWWYLQIMTMNLSAAMTRLVLAPMDESWKTRRFKALRFLLIGLPGRVVDHARNLILRVGAEASALLEEIRVRVKGLVRAPA